MFYKCYSIENTRPGSILIENNSVERKDVGIIIVLCGLGGGLVRFSCNNFQKLQNFTKITTFYENYTHLRNIDCTAWIKKTSHFDLGGAIFVRFSNFLYQWKACQNSVILIHHLRN